MPKIMIADDDEFIRYYLRNLLEYMDFSIIAECKNGQEIYDALMNSKPDILLLDIHMPELNGDKFLLDNKELVKDVLVIVLTMSISDEIKNKLKDEGFTHFLRKNISPMELVKIIDDIWLEHVESNKV